jgi:hypothetical protein
MSETRFKNRYGDEYWFKQLTEDTYAVCGDLKYWRYGGKEGQEGINELDLGFVDPSGGPFITAGYKINGRTVTQISSQGEELIFKVV